MTCRVSAGPPQRRNGSNPPSGGTESRPTSAHEDPIFGAVYGGIKKDIDWALAAGRLRGALLLIYAGMDTMAWVGMGPSKQDVERSDFVAWTEKYIRFDGEQQLTGLDLYGARCALLHNYSVTSKLSKESKCRMIGYEDNFFPPVRYEPKISKDLLMVSLHHLAQAFFVGLDRFLVDVFADPSRREAAEERLRELITQLPFESRA